MIELKIAGATLNAYINQGGGVTISDPKKEGRDAVKIASQSAEAVLLLAILEALTTKRDAELQQLRDQVARLEDEVRSWASHE